MARATETTLEPPRAASKPLSVTLLRGFNKLPVHLALIFFAVLWSIPTIALLVSSFREPGDVVTSGWWNALTNFNFTLDNYEDVLNTA